MTDSTLAGNQPEPESRLLGEYDRLESDDDLNTALRVLHIAQRKFLTREAVPAVAQGSILDEERRHTARNPIASLVLSQRARALDNIERLFDLMVDTEDGRVTAHPFAPYSLVRAVIEAAATGLWLIQTNRKADRVLRALQLEYRNTTERGRLIELFVPGADLVHEQQRAAQVVDRLNELKDTVPPLRQYALTGPPKYSAIVSAVSARDPDNGGRTFMLNSPIMVWKSASAFIHGSDDVIRALSDVRQLHEFQSGIATFELTPSLRMLATNALVCVDLIIALEARFAFLASHDYGGRAVVTAP